MFCTCTFGQDLPGRLTALSFLLSRSVGMCVLLVHAEKELMILKVLVSYSMQVVVMGCSWNWGNVFRSDGSLPALTDWPNSSCSIFQKKQRQNGKALVFVAQRKHSCLDLCRSGRKFPAFTPAEQLCDPYHSAQGQGACVHTAVYQSTCSSCCLAELRGCLWLDFFCVGNAFLLP